MFKSLAPSVQNSIRQNNKMLFVVDEPYGLHTFHEAVPTKGVIVGANSSHRKHIFNFYQSMDTVIKFDYVEATGIIERRPDYRQFFFDVFVKDAISYTKVMAKKGLIITSFDILVVDAYLNSLLKIKQQQSHNKILYVGIWEKPKEERIMLNETVA